MNLSVAAAAALLMLTPGKAALKALALPGGIGGRPRNTDKTSWRLISCRIRLPELDGQATITSFTG